MLTQNELKKQLNYNKYTGIFIRKVSPNGKNKIGEVAGSFINGYIKISVLGKSYTAHRLAWLYEYGKFPDKHLDHINNIKSDNRISNLREVTVCENMKNKSIGKNNKSGVVGVKWNKSKNAWEVQINVNKKRIYLGSTKDLEKAKKLRLDAEEKYGFTTKHSVVGSEDSDKIYIDREFNYLSKNGERTKESVIHNIYYNQVSNSKARGHESPAYTIEEFKKYMLNNDTFNRLFKLWKESGELVSEIPSCDRLDESRGYSFDNIEIVTFKENETRFKIKKRLNQAHVDQKPVLRFDVTTGEVIGEYQSISEANRQTGVANTVISRHCNGQIKTPRKHSWKFA